MYAVNMSPESGLPKLSTLAACNMASSLAACAHFDAVVAEKVREVACQEFSDTTCLSNDSR
jgi:hypothetical protein